jgi:peroxiredoxin
MRMLTLLLAMAVILPAAGQFSNRRAPGFSIADSKFVQHDLQDYRGKVLILDIMLTSCPTCNQLADTLVQMKKKYGDRIAILSIVTLPDTFAEADAFTIRHGLTWPIVFDSGQVIVSYLKVTPANPKIEFPHVFLIDGTGTIRSDFDSTDEAKLTEDGFSAEIDKLFAAAK